jgi:hypothetical protein
VFKQPKDSDSPVDKPPSKAKQTEMELAKALEEISRLKRRGDGSLFDLKHDKAEDIARTIADTIGESKWKAIRKAADERFKSKSRPAG